MSTHTVHATITVEVANPALLALIPGARVAAGADERAQLEAAVNAGLKELGALSGRYGLTITDASATVD